MKIVRYTVFLPLLILLCAGGGNGMLTLLKSAPKTTEAASAAEADFTDRNGFLAVEIESPLSPVFRLILIGRSLQRQCRRHPDHTVTLSQQEADLIYRLSCQAKARSGDATERSRTPTK